MTCIEAVHVEVYAGDDTSLIVDVIDEEGNPVTVSDALAAEFLIVAYTADTVLVRYLLGAEISAQTTSFTVEVAGADTAPLVGLQRIAMRFTDAAGDEHLILEGLLLIQENIFAEVTP